MDSDLTPGNAEGFFIATLPRADDTSRLKFSIAVIVDILGGKGVMHSCVGHQNFCLVSALSLRLHPTVDNVFEQCQVKLLIDMNAVIC